MRDWQKTRIAPGSAIDAVVLVHLEASLNLLLTRPEHQRPFVVLSDGRTEQFVQWCGSKTKPLLFDVPAKGIALEPAPDVRASAVRGIEVLREMCGGFPQGLVLLDENSSSSLPGASDELIMAPALMSGLRLRQMSRGGS
jgi:hypothetical protein